MRILVLTNTPAHVHLYRHAITRLRRRGHDVLVLGRAYDCTIDLLEYFELSYEMYGRHDVENLTTVSYIRTIAGQFRSIATHARRFQPDVVFGRGPYAAVAGTISRAPTVLLLDDEPGDVNHTISRPFANCILSPRYTRRELGRNHYTFDGLKECAYLHPDVFERDESIREDLGVERDEPYVLVRFNALDALHDAGLEGFTPSQRVELLESLSTRATVFVSDEGDDLELDSVPAQAYDLHPGRIHDAMAEAALLIADTGTMVNEAALLGTPAIRYRGTNTHEYGEFAALEDAQLAFQFDDFDHVRDCAIEILNDGSDDVFGRRRDEFMDSVVNVTDLIVDVAESRGAIDPVRSTTERLQHASLSTESLQQTGN